MWIKKSNNRPFGARFNTREQQAIDIEVKKQLREWDLKHAREIDAIVLWILHEEFGFGYKRLKRFHDSFNPAIRGLVDRYELEESDLIWLCTKKLKEHGEDLDEWYKEYDENLHRIKDQITQGAEDKS